MPSISKQIYELVELLLQDSQCRSIIVDKNNNILNYLLMAYHAAFCCELVRKYGDNDD